MLVNIVDSFVRKKVYLLYFSYLLTLIDRQISLLFNQSDRSIA